MERLAETSLAYRTEDDRGEAYWVADDTIREAYSLPSQEDLTVREQGFSGWLGSRLDLVRSGWRKLVELSKALAARIGDPLADLEREDEIKNRATAGERWSQIGRLEKEIEADPKVKTDQVEAPKPVKRSGGFSH